MNNKDLNNHLANLETISRIGANVATMIAGNVSNNMVIRELGQTIGQQLSALHQELTGEALAPLVKDHLLKRVEWQKAMAARRQERIDKWKKEQAPIVWKNWHLRALAFKGEDSAYISQLAAEIPCGDCKTGFAGILARVPAEWDKPDWDYFAYTVEIHNIVNNKLDKPVLSLDKARKIYAR